MDFVKNTPNESRAGSGSFLDAMATDPHRDFQHDQLSKTANRAVPADKRALRRLPPTSPVAVKPTAALSSSGAAFVLN